MGACRLFGAGFGENDRIRESEIPAHSTTPAGGHKQKIQKKNFHNELWKHAGTRDFARRRIYDIRTALSLIAFGVTDFATLNLKDFQNLGFKTVWNPLSTA